MSLCPLQGQTACQFTLFSTTAMQVRATTLLILRLAMRSKLRAKMHARLDERHNEVTAPQ